MGQLLAKQSIEAELRKHFDLQQDCSETVRRGYFQGLLFRFLVLLELLIFSRLNTIQLITTGSRNRPIVLFFLFTSYIFPSSPSSISSYSRNKMRLATAKTFMSSVFRSASGVAPVAARVAAGAVEIGRRGRACLRSGVAAAVAAFLLRSGGTDVDAQEDLLDDNPPQSKDVPAQGTDEVPKEIPGRGNR